MDSFSVPVGEPYVIAGLLRIKTRLLRHYFHVHIRNRRRSKIMEENGNPGTILWVTNSAITPITAVLLATAVGIFAIILFWFCRICNSRTNNQISNTTPVSIQEFFGKISNNLGSWLVRTKLTRHESRYEYTALEADTNSHERLELERKARQRAESACLHYLRFCPRYALIQHLNDIGSRVGKHWFVVKDSSIKTERLLTLTPQSQNSPIVYNQITRRIILDLFLALQHPYIYPILDLEFIEGKSKNANIIVVLPFNNKGSLKDLIYKTCWHDEWADKYSQRSKGLPVSQIQRLGRQILEALFFLHEREYTFSFHLHSGNVILQNGVARLSGLENPLLGFTSRIYPVIVKNPLLQINPTAVDVICFGHVLFEMTSGYELTEPEPTAVNMLDVAHCTQVVEILDFIFKNPKKRIPSVEELLISDFFRNIDLREMRAISLPVLQVKLTSPSMALLNKIKEHQLSLMQTKNVINDDDDENAKVAAAVNFSSQQLRYNVKIQKHKSCEASSSQAVIESANSSPIDKDEYTFLTNNEEHRRLNLHQRKLDVTLLEMQNLCRN